MQDDVHPVNLNETLIVGDDEGNARKQARHRRLMNSNTKQRREVMSEKRNVQKIRIKCPTCGFKSEGEVGPDAEIYAEHIACPKCESVLRSARATYQKRPVQVLAYQTNIPMEVGTLHGMTMAEPGDWVITGPDGDVWPCKPNIFEKTYIEITPVPDPNTAKLMEQALDDAYLVSDSGESVKALDLLDELVPAVAEVQRQRDMYLAQIKELAEFLLANYKDEIVDSFDTMNGETPAGTAMRLLKK